MNWLYIILLCYPAIITAKQGSCRAAKKCCDGKDSNCAVQDTPLNEIIEDLSEDEPCYCDHGCLDVGDCCPDFKDYCGVIDCQVSEWSSWSKCNVACGIGTSIRTREVIRPESNGGKQCPHMEEKETCRASKCSNRNLDRVSAFSETAMLLPGKYAPKTTKKYEVRSNLRSYSKKEGQRYCVVFKVDKAMRSCRHDADTKALHRGNTVCVLCDSKSQRSHLGGRCTGHGSEGKRTRFKNVLTPRCSGKWTRMLITDDGECPCKEGATFMFV